MRRLVNSIWSVLALLALLGAPGEIRAEEATKADPTHYTVDFENDAVRVVRIKYGPGEKSVMHEHVRDGVLVFLTDQRVRFTHPDGKAEEVLSKAGETAWIAAETHLPENVSGQPLELIYVEIKR